MEVEHHVAFGRSALGFKVIFHLTAINVILAYNLALISDADLVTTNTNQRFPPELETVRTLNKLKKVTECVILII